MRYFFSKNQKLGFFEELIWDHFYNEDLDLIERGNVSSGFIIICFILAIVLLTYVCYVA